jgi:hypothetical protein
MACYNTVYMVPSSDTCQQLEFPFETQCLESVNTHSLAMCKGGEVQIDS